MLMKRPLSPHLSIYKLQLTSGLSILHRLSGVCLYLGLIFFSWIVFLFVYFPHMITAYVGYIANYLTLRILTKTILFAWAFCLLYHLFNGIRHLFWDIGKGLDLRSTYWSGRLVIALSLLSTLICWMLTCFSEIEQKGEIKNTEMMKRIENEQN